jgi:DNA primase
VREAVPLSRQLLAHAAEGLDLSTAEGRAKMLALARPLWAQLPAGTLRAQVLTALAEAGGMPADTLSADWAGTTLPRSTPRRTQWVAASRRRTQEATRLLDRAAWLLARQPDLWVDLSESDHALLGSLPLPHGPFFCALERIVHDHGHLTLDALDDEIRALSDAESIQPLMDRVRSLHHFEQDEHAGADLQALMHRLRQQAVDEELQLLMESGDLSDDARRRGKDLLARRAALRAEAPKSESRQL